MNYTWLKHMHNIKQQMREFNRQKMECWWPCRWRQPVKGTTWNLKSNHANDLEQKTETQDSKLKSSNSHRNLNLKNVHVLYIRYQKLNFRYLHVSMGLTVSHKTFFPHTSSFSKFLQYRNIHAFKFNTLFYL